MTTAPRPLEGQCEWTASDMADESEWTARFDDGERAEIDGALRHAQSVSGDILEIGVEDFPLPTVSTRLAGIERELIDGRGFVRLRGLERDRYTQPEMEMIYWGIGLHLGVPWPQNQHGHVLGDVVDQGKGLDDPTARGNEIGGAALPFHCDGSDLVGLMCLSNGRHGGLSAVANSVRIHNRLVEEDPEAAEEMYRPQPYDFRGEQPEGGSAWYEVPVFTEWDGRLFVRCIPPYIFASQRHPDAPRLTPAARRGLERIVALADDPRNHVTMELRPGDMQFINNYHVMHGRTAYADDPTSGRIRHLKRLWLETKVLDERPPWFRNNVSSHWNQRRRASQMKVV